MPHLPEKAILRSLLAMPGALLVRGSMPGACSALAAALRCASRVWMHATSGKLAAATVSLGAAEQRQTETFHPLPNTGNVHAKMQRGILNIHAFGTGNARKLSQQRRLFSSPATSESQRITAACLCGRYGACSKRMLSLARPALQQTIRQVQPDAVAAIDDCSPRRDDRPESDGQEAPQTRRAVGRWLLATAAFAAGVVVLGGLTRLTESGLSMVHWRWVHFAAPRTEEQWAAELALYLASPEGRTLNADMDVASFRRIYWMEHGHRVAGRVLGLAVLVPAAYLLTLGRRHVPTRGLRAAIAAAAVLVVAQGAMGWHMVRSGLRDGLGTSAAGPARVSHYRLAAHLGLALALYGVCLGAGLRVVSGAPLRLLAGRRRLRAAAHGLAGLAVLTALGGALVAGLDAGLLYDTFPLMGGRVVPSDLLDARIAPAVLNAVANPSAVQFVHRVMGVSTVAGLSGLWLAVRRSPHAAVQRAAAACAAAAWAQACLGVATLLLHVPVPLASAHQAGALVLVGSLVRLLRVL